MSVSGKGWVKNIFSCVKNLSKKEYRRNGRREDWSLSRGGVPSVGKILRRMRRMFSSSRKFPKG